MGLTELIELLANSALPPSASAILIAWVLKPVFFRVIDVWATNLDKRVKAEEQRIKAEEQRVKAEEKRADNEDKQTNVLVNVERALDNNTRLTQSMLELLSPIAKIPERLDSIGEAMTERANRRDEALRERLGRIQDAITNLPDAYLGKTAAHFDPKLAGIQAAIDQLKTQIESKPDVLTPEMVREIRSELGKIARLVTALSEKKEIKGGN